MHEHDHSRTKRRLAVSIAINAVIFVVELTGGLLIHSLALISDAIHNLSDFFALILSYIAARIVTRKPDAGRTFGYVRIEIFVAFINAVTLVLIGGYIVYEGFRRISHPSPIPGAWMLGIAAVGFVANTAATLLLRGDAKHNINARSAYLHLLTDAIESLAVIVVGALIFVKRWYWLDPVVSVAIGLFIVRSAWSILSETVHTLTEGTPKGIDVYAVADFIRRHEGVVDVHHLHIWTVSTSLRALSAHVVVEDQSISRACGITRDLEATLARRYGINHATIQLEVSGCTGQAIIGHHSDVPTAD